MLFWFNLGGKDLKLNICRMVLVVLVLYILGIWELIFILLEYFL